MEDGVHHWSGFSFDANALGTPPSPPSAAEVDDTIDIEIREDLKMDVPLQRRRGQKVSKTSNAVRLTHLPISIVVACQISVLNTGTAKRPWACWRRYDLELKRQEAGLNVCAKISRMSPGLARSAAMYCIPTR